MRKLTLALFALAVIGFGILLNRAMSVPVRITIGEIVQVESGYSVWIGREYMFFRTREDAASRVLELQKDPRYVVGFKE